MTGKRMLVVGAHPDDAEFHAGGLMCRWRELGHSLKILALTDGGAGHQSMAWPALVDRRQEEAARAAALLDAELAIWREPDGGLVPGIQQRRALIREIRAYRPDLIVTHRQADYHPDHRAAAILVQDAAYLLQVPNIEPEAAPLEQLPVILLMADDFEYPQPFRADYVLDTSNFIERVVELLNCHASQVYEWLPHTLNQEVPDQDRKAWLSRWYGKRPRHRAKQYANAAVAFAEAYEVSPYGRAFDPMEFDL